MTDLDDNMDDIFGAPLTTNARDAGERIAVAFTKEPTVFTERCPSCKGRGRFISYAGRDCGPCFKCKGAKTLTFKSSPEQRAQGRATAAKAAERKADSARTMMEAWMAANPEDTLWLKAKVGTFDFATSMQEALLKYGTLTEKQHATVTRLRIADDERKAARAAEAAAVAAAAPIIDIAAIEQAFESAIDNSIKRPKLRLDTFKFSLAPSTGTNAGAVYVKQDEVYLGKIKDGKLVRSRDCDAATEARIVEVCADPKAAAVAYGQREGSCSCCGRALTNHASIDLGIGPICAEKFGW